MSSLVGLDPSLRSFGVAYRSSDNKIRATVIKGGGKGLGNSALLIDSVMRIIDRLSPSTVAIEGYAFGQLRGGTNAILDIAEVCGVIKLMLVSRGIDLLIVPPATMKIFIAGKGNAKKQDVANVLYRDYDLIFTKSDHYDAAGILLVAEAYAIMRSISRVRSSASRRVLSGCTHVPANAIDCTFL